MTAPKNTHSDPLPGFYQRWRTFLELTLLGAIWGSSYLFMRIAARDFGAVALVEIRLLAGALILLPFLWHARTRFPLALWPKLAGIGLLNTALPFLLFAWAAQRAPAGVGAIANATTALFTVLIAALFFGERITTRGGLALLAGFVGVVVLASGKMAGASVGWAAAAGTCASLMYAVAFNLVRKYLSGLPNAAVAAATIGTAALLLLPFALWQWPDAEISAGVWGAALTLGALCTGVAYWLYYRLVARIGPSRTSTVTFLVPLFAVGWAVHGLLIARVTTRDSPHQRSQ